MLASFQPSASLDGAGRGPAGGELDGESHAAAVRSSAALEAGCGAGGRKPAVHLVDAETDDGIARFRRGRRLQATDRGHAAADQAADVGMISGLIRLRAADGDDDVATIRAPTTTATSRRPIPSPSASLKGRAVLWSATGWS